MGKPEEGSGAETGDEKRGNKTGTVPYYNLFSFADSFDYSLILVGTLGAIANGICMPLMTILFGNLLHVMMGSLNIKDGVHEAREVSLKFIYLGLSSGFASFLQTSCWMITGQRQAARMRGMYLHAILRQDIAFFDKEVCTGEIVSSLSSDIILIQDAMSDKAGSFIQLVVTVIGGFIVAFSKGWLLTFAMIAIIPPLVITGAIMLMLLAKLQTEAQSSYALAAKIVDQTIGSIRTVASFSGERQAIKDYDNALTKAYKSGLYEGFSSGTGYGMLMLTLFSSYGYAMWIGGKMIINKGYTGGTVINVMFAVVLGSLSLGQTSQCITAFAAGQAAAFKMFETINRKPEINASDSRGRKFKGLSGDIELRDVYFSYPTRLNEMIFKGLSLFIPSGSTAALVGPSGSGKSSIINLIERFYDPQQGEVLIGGINLRKFQLKWIREKIGLVSQEPVLFSTSIMDNIAFGKENATVEEIKAAVALSNAANFINKLPEGLDTLVGEHGIQLSGGQKQRIAIARAILKDPKILLLDEATSALDSESERVVQEALDQVMVNRTTVIVAHRLSTVKNADIIYVLQQGMIVERGQHSELMKDPNGVYRNLIRLQEVGKSSRSVPVRDLENNHISMWVPIGMSPVVSASARTPGKMSEMSLDFEELTQQTQPSLARLAYLNTPEIPVLLLGSIGAAVNGVIYPVFGLMLANLMETFYEPPHELRKDSESWALKFVALGLGSLVSTPSATFFFAMAGSKLIKRIRSMCFEKVVYMQIGWFDEAENSSGSIGARLSGDATSVRYMVGDTMALLVQNIATSVAGLVIGFKTNWELALIILLLIPLMGLGGYIQVTSMKGFGADAKKMYENASQVASDAVGSIRTVASFCAEERTVQLYRRKCEGPLTAGIRQGLISGFSFGSSFFFMYFVYSMSFYSGAQLVDRGKTDFHKVFRVFFALCMTALGISHANSLAPDAGKARSSATSVLQILDLKSKIDSSNSTGIKLKNVKGNIKFHHVRFKYPTRPDIEVLHGFCLSIDSGQTVALVGESGCGKSTVISLLQRYYDPDSGSITLDGKELRKLNVKWLRQQIGLVSQEPVLFNVTIRENIAYGKDGKSSEAEIIAAAKLANAHDFISGFQQGYETVVGERGIQLSGGQKQRVAIARAIVKSPRILLLDEATSALDAESERVVQAALEQAMINRTTLVVAHRLSTVKNADMIAVVKNGAIAEKGKHEALLNISNGIYASLVGSPQASMG